MKNNEPAFPVGSGDMRDPTGLTKLEYFAAKAMQGMLASNYTHYDGQGDPQSFSKLAFEFAQAMLAEAERIQNANKD